MAIEVYAYLYLITIAEIITFIRGTNRTNERGCGIVHITVRDTGSPSVLRFTSYQKSITDILMQSRLID